MIILLKKNTKYLFCLLLTAACASTGNITVNNLNDTGSPQPGSFIYSLPLTVFDVSLTAEEISIIPGPYARFAEKYLGIQHAPQKPEKLWSIKNITLKNHTEADPDFIYSLQGVGNTGEYPDLNRLLENRLILTPASFSAEMVNQYACPPKTGEILYTDLSVKRNFEAEKDVEVSLVMPDTLYVSKPSSRNALKEKTIEQKAEEAANFIIKLKKRRFKLVAGQYDYMPEGEAMSAALNELARIEEEYLSLFVGKRIRAEIRQDFHYVPAGGKEAERAVVCRFSPDSGFLDSRESTGLPVILEMNASNKVRGLSRFKIPLKPPQNVIYYRIADQVAVKLTAGEQVWAVAILPVFQWGAMVPVYLQK
ncbi:MAG: DUF4831 family protein [Bacteroidales bacterium]|nr:DUF4831 family protein [Bacteroidales bacterium]